MTACHWVHCPVNILRFNYVDRFLIQSWSHVKHISARAHTHTHSRTALAHYLRNVFGGWKRYVFFSSCRTIWRFSQGRAFLESRLAEKSRVWEMRAGDGELFQPRWNDMPQSGRTERWSLCGLMITSSATVQCPLLDVKHITTKKTKRECCLFLCLKSIVKFSGSLHLIKTHPDL